MLTALVDIAYNSTVDAYRFYKAGGGTITGFKSDSKVSTEINSSVGSKLLPNNKIKDDCNKLISE